MTHNNEHDKMKKISQRKTMLLYSLLLHITSVFSNCQYDNGLATVDKHSKHGYLTVTNVVSTLSYDSPKHRKKFILFNLNNTHQQLQYAITISISAKRETANFARLLIYTG